MGDQLGYTEEGYLGTYNSGDGSSTIVHDYNNCGSMTVASSNKEGRAKSSSKNRMHDPNTYSQLRMLGLTTPNARRYEHDETMRRTQSQLAEQEREEEDVKRMVRKQQVCVEGALVTLIVLSVVALVVILVIVLRK